MVVKVVRHCTHVLLINAAWNEGEARKVECFEAGSGGKRMSSVLTVLVLNSTAKFGWIACFNYCYIQFTQHREHTASP